jgi:hypothetical protein
VGRNKLGLILAPQWPQEQLHRVSIATPDSPRRRFSDQTLGTDPHSGAPPASGTTVPCGAPIGSGGRFWNLCCDLLLPIAGKGHTKPCSSGAAMTRMMPGCARGAVSSWLRPKPEPCGGGLRGGGGP